jgi:MFS family permease
MQISYGWVIVGAGMVVTCVGFGAMFSLAVFLQPMSDTMGWSSTGISTAALLNFLCMGVGSFAWGALSDRLGTRAVVLLGGVLLGFGTVMASQAHSLGQFQVYFGVVVGFAAGSLYVPMTATTARWFTRHRSLAVALVSAGLGLDSTTTAPLARWIISSYDWRTAMLVIGDLAWLFIIPAALLVREPLEPAAGSLSEVTSGVDGRELTAAQALCTTRSIAMSGSSSARGIGLGGVAIACTFRPPRPLPAALATPSVAH